MRKIQGFVLFLFLISCSSLPTKEVELAKVELDKAKSNQAEELAQKEFQLAQEAFSAAEKFMQEKKGDQAKAESLKSLEKSRRSILDAKESRAREKIKKVETLLEEATKIGVNQEKINPAQSKLTEAKEFFDQGVKAGESVRKSIGKLEPLAELDLFIQSMDNAFQRAEEAEKLIQLELEKQRKAAELYSSITHGRTLVQTLQKDPFVATFYLPERDQVIQDFEAFTKLVEEGDLENAESRKKSYDRLVAFFNEMRDMKLALGASYQQISQKMIDKINAYYRQDAESYLEKARRLREEVYKIYGKPDLDQQTPRQIEKKAEFLRMRLYPIQQQAGGESSAAEDALFRQLDGLYQDAESHFEKEEYTDSIDKAKESIELAEKMLKLKKAMSTQKDSGQAGFQSQTGVAEVSFQPYQVKKGDCLWKIAMKKSVYGKAYLWPLIWFANKNVVKDPDLIEPGTRLKIPVFQ